jgi:protein translocase SecG subunit
MLNILQYLEMTVAILLCLIVLVQSKNVSLNLSSMSWGMDTITKRWPEKILHNATIILGALFIINSILLYVIKA